MGEIIISAIFKSRSEQEPEVYYLAARFVTKQEAALLYYAVQETIKEGELSDHRFLQLWEEASEKPWYVVVIGGRPADALHEQLTKALEGEMKSLPQEAFETLLLRRASEIRKSPWVEGH